MKTRGVNLGNWLVLERWMAPEIFEGIEGQGETSFMKNWGSEAAERLKAHRDSWITYDDFKWIKEAGLNTVRIPIAHWIYGDYAPNLGCIDYLDKAIEWANSLDLKVLIDMHGAAGSQNGEMHSGLEGPMDFLKSEANIQRTIDVMGKLSDRYKDEKCLWGMQLLNEPHPTIDNEKLRDYYTRCYFEIRKHLDEDKEILFHDQFNLESWRNFMQGPEFKNVGIDVHIYHCFGNDGMAPLSSYVDDQLRHWSFALDNMRKYFKIYVGEWSLSINKGVYNGPFKDKNTAQKDAFYRMFAGTQLINYEQNTDGWFFWSYKVTNPEYRAQWCYKDLVDEFQAFPKKLLQD